MQNIIGSVSGQVYRFLEENGKKSVTKIVDNIDQPRSSVYMGIGWLAKEGKLKFDTEGKGTKIGLI